jgi:hypothetical protein
LLLGDAINNNKRVVIAFSFFKFASVVEPSHPCYTIELGSAAMQAKVVKRH